MTNPCYNLEISICVKILSQSLNLMSYLKKSQYWSQKIWSKKSLGISVFFLTPRLSKRGKRRIIRGDDLVILSISVFSLQRGRRGCFPEERSLFTLHTPTSSPQGRTQGQALPIYEGHDHGGVRLRCHPRHRLPHRLDLAS